MHISDILAKGPTCSFEFFPPKTEKGAETLYETIQQLENLRPSFVSVTYGAGGSTRDLTHDLVVRIKDSTSLDPIPHLTVVCHGEDEIRSILERYAQANVSNVLALAGDPPANKVDYNRKHDAFQHAGDLVRFIRRFNEEGHHSSERGFGIGYFISSILAQIVLSFFASMIVMWFSRRREFRADEGGADLAGKHKMISALKKLQGDQAEDLPGEFAAFGINGGRPTGLRALFMSHPPLEERIAALQRSA